MKRAEAHTKVMLLIRRVYRAAPCPVPENKRRGGAHGARTQRLVVLLIMSCTPRPFPA